MGTIVSARAFAPDFDIRGGEFLPAGAGLRAHLIEALPHAAAVVRAHDKLIVVDRANAHWERFELKTPKQRFIERLECTEAMHEVLAGRMKPIVYEWRDGGIVDGRYYFVSLAPIRPMDGESPRGLITLIDRTSEVTTEKTMRIELASDPLTGLPNRRGFVDEIEARIDAEDGLQHAVLVIDLLRFAHINECLGTLGGDELTITVARRLVSVLRGHDQLARTGANQFGVVLELTGGGGDIAPVVERIEEVFARPFRMGDFEIKVDCAIGGAMLADCEGDAEKVVHHAQVALNTARSSERFELYQRATLAAARRHFTIETELRYAIERNELDMAFQPLIGFATGKVVGFEALARWNHKTLGTVPPNEFIAVAEESGLIVPLGRWALDKALSTLVRWDKAAKRTLPLYVGVNLSAIQVARDDLAALVGGALERHKVSGYRLSVELTESAIVSDADRAEKTFDALKAVDAMIAMDDFGTGFSNLASLQRLPIDTLKIDRSFVTGMLDDPDKTAIVRAVLGLAQSLGMTTTAEGIETRELAQALAAMGCTTGQGWYYAPGLDRDAALDFALKSLDPAAHG